MSEWQDRLAGARKNLAALTDHLEALTSLRDEATAQINQFARSEGITLNLPAIQATLNRPYVLVPTTNPNEWYLVAWRGVSVPVVGWIVSQSDAFTVSRVTRTMNLLAPVPEWMRAEMGWKAPDHAAYLDTSKTVVKVTGGDPVSFRRRYGTYLGGPVEGGFKIKGGKAWINLVAALIGDGILPYQPQAVKPADWNAKAETKISLRSYQVDFVREFVDSGAILINLPPGGGKTYITLDVIAHIRGKVLIFAENTILVEQWRERVREFCPGADATVLTYASGKKAKNIHWTLVVFDEAHRLPATTFSELAFLDTQYRIGLTGTPWREDKRQFMIAALAGKPCAIPWNDLIGAGVLRRPRVAVAVVRTMTDKLAFIRSALARHRTGRVLIFSDHIEYGKDLSRALDVPFVHGETPKKLERVQEAPICIVSQIAQQGVDFPDLSLVIEADIALSGTSRTAEAQRVGRLMHSATGGEHYILFTMDEFPRFKNRMLGVEGEIGEVEYIDLTSGALKETERMPKRRTPKPQVVAVKEGDEAGAALASPAIRRLILDHEKNLGATRQGYMAKAFRILWKSDGTSEELRLRDGKAEKAWEPYRAGLNMLVKAGLAKKVDGRYYLDRARVNALRG